MSLSRRKTRVRAHRRRGTEGVRKHFRRSGRVKVKRHKRRLR